MSSYVLEKLELTAPESSAYHSGIWNILIEMQYLFTYLLKSFLQNNNYGSRVLAENGCLVVNKSGIFVSLYISSLELIYLFPL